MDVYSEVNLLKEDQIVAISASPKIKINKNLILNPNPNPLIKSYQG